MISFRLNFLSMVETGKRGAVVQQVDRLKWGVRPAGGYPAGCQGLLIQWSKSCTGCFQRWLVPFRVQVVALGIPGTWRCAPKGLQLIKNARQFSGRQSPQNIGLTPVGSILLETQDDAAALEHVLCILQDGDESFLGTFRQKAARHLQVQSSLPQHRLPMHLCVLGQVEHESQLHTAMICTTVAAAYVLLQKLIYNLLIPHTKGKNQVRLKKKNLRTTKYRQYFLMGFKIKLIAL